MRVSWAWPNASPPKAYGPTLAGVSARLAAVAHFARTTHGVADVGTDHARLPIAMIHAGWAARAVAIDRMPAPLRAAASRVSASGVADRVELRQGDGLQPLAPGDVDTVVVAGVGGRTVCDVLEPERLRALNIRRVVVQPNRDDAYVRGYLSSQGWPLADETLVYDAGRFFYIAVAEPGPRQTLTPVDRWLGPVLRYREDPIADAFRRIRFEWLRQRRRDDETAAVLAALDGGGSPE